MSPRPVTARMDSVLRTPRPLPGRAAPTMAIRAPSMSATGSVLPASTLRAMPARRAVPRQESAMRRRAVTARMRPVLRTSEPLPERAAPTMATRAPSISVTAPVAPASTLRAMLAPSAGQRRESAMPRRAVTARMHSVLRTPRPLPGRAAPTMAIRARSMSAMARVTPASTLRAMPARRAGQRQESAMRRRVARGRARAVRQMVFSRVRSNAAPRAGSATRRSCAPAPERTAPMMS